MLRRRVVDHTRSSHDLHSTHISNGDLNEATLEMMSEASQRMDWQTICYERSLASAHAPNTPSLAWYEGCLIMPGYKNGLNRPRYSFLVSIQELSEEFQICCTCSLQEKWPLYSCRKHCMRSLIRTALL